MKNGETAPLDAVPIIPPQTMRDGIADALASGSARVLAFFAIPSACHAATDENAAAADAPATDAGADSKVAPVCRIFSVIGDAFTGEIKITATQVEGDYPSFTPEIPQLHWFEREIAEQTGIIPAGHPRLAPIRAPLSASPLRQAAAAAPAPSAATCEAAHQVAVGPVHAGVIEPGHFRFQCLGEDVSHLEISLGYQHRGIEKLLAGGPSPATPHIIETAAGDSTIAAAWNYAAIIEALGGAHAPSPDELSRRAILLELERIANHVGDLGALAGDVAFLPTMSYCGRIRGEFLNMTAEICGNRFGRGAITPGGTNKSISPEIAAKLRAWIFRVKPELDNALELAFDEPTVLDRFEGTGAVSAAAARQIGMVGVAARASGLATDARRDFPTNTPAAQPVPALARRAQSGDTLARALVRRHEINASIEFLLDALLPFEPPAPPAPRRVPSPPTAPRLRPNAISVSVIESWRGELVHMAATDSAGKFHFYKIIDPSFHNWFGLALALRGEQISNFPICNKSFNLSYCGHDL